MDYPSSFIEGKYRNPIDQVSKFFNEKHPGKYWIINVSERATYDAEKYFEGRVSGYHFPDHYAPTPFTFLPKIAKLAEIWLKADSENVIAVHCNSGKGRTGTVICAIMLYIGLYDNAEDCLRLYAH